MKNKAVLVDVLSVQETGIENHFQYGSDNDVRRAEGSSAGTGRRTDLHLEVSCSDARPQIQILFKQNELIRPSRQPLSARLCLSAGRMLRCVCSSSALFGPTTAGSLWIKVRFLRPVRSLKN